MNLLTHVPTYKEVYVTRGSDEEAKIRESNPTVWEGVDSGGHYVGLCLDQNRVNCILCRNGSTCEYSLRPQKEKA